MCIALQWQHLLPPPRLFYEEVSVLPPELLELFVVDDEVELIERRLLLLPRIEEQALRIRVPWGWTSSVLVVGYLLQGLVFR